MGADASIIIVSYNTQALTLACLESVCDQTITARVKIIVIDNASTDGSADAVAGVFGDRVRLIRLDRNVGFARANNIAACCAEGEYLLLLNPDTVVLDHAVDRIIAFALAHGEHRIYGGRTLHADGSCNPTSCWRRQTMLGLVAQAAGLTSFAPASRACNPETYGASPEGHVDIVSGCFFLIEKKLWDALGGFDPAFFMYGEDADLCLRARTLGARPVIAREATIIHLGGRSEASREGKLVRLIGAKAMLIRRHWAHGLAPIGETLLMLWPVSRAIAWSVLIPVRPGALARARCWWNVVRRVSPGRRARTTMHIPCARREGAQQVRATP